MLGCCKEILNIGCFNSCDDLKVDFDFTNHPPVFTITTGNYRIYFKDGTMNGYFDFVITQDMIDDNLYELPNVFKEDKTIVMQLHKETSTGVYELATNTCYTLKTIQCNNLS